MPSTEIFKYWQKGEGIKFQNALSIKCGDGGGSFSPAGPLGASPSASSKLAAQQTLHWGYKAILGKFLESLMRKRQAVFSPCIRDDLVPSLITEIGQLGPTRCPLGQHQELWTRAAEWYCLCLSGTHFGLFWPGNPEVHESMSPTLHPPANIPVQEDFRPVLPEQQPAISPEWGPPSTPPTPLTLPAGPELIISC